MAQITWITPAGDLGTYAENSELDIQLEASSPLAPVSSLGFDPRTSIVGNGRTNDVSVFMPAEKNSWTITSRDLPGLVRTGLFPNPQNPQYIAPQFVELHWPYRGGLNKSKPSMAPAQGPIGISSVGIYFFGPESAQTIPGMVSGSRWTLNAGAIEMVGEDAFGGHPAPNQPGQPDNGPGVYHYHDTLFINNNAWSDVPGWDGVYTHDNGHSKIIGWAADGYPIYGPWGYRNAMDPASGVKRMQSGYTIASPTPARPISTRLSVTASAVRTNVISVSGLPFVGMCIDLVGHEDWKPGSVLITKVNNDGTVTLNRIVTVKIKDQLTAYFKLGNFIEDWEYTAPVGTNLDRHNGRFCVTPEFPSGTYAYFATQADNGTPAFPYIIGPTYYGSTSIDNDVGVASLVPPSQLALTFKLLSGQLPPGTQLVPTTGQIYGYPVVTDPGSSVARKYTFTIRASDSRGQVADRGFTIAINNIIPPKITSSADNTGSFGIYFNSDYVSLQLDAIDVNPQASLTWSVVAGQLPPGLKLDQKGLISGFALATGAPGPAGSSAYDVGRFDQFVWDFEGSTLSKTYQFTVRLYDGINYIDQRYNIIIYNKEYFRCDNTIIHVDTGIFTADRDGFEYPAITTPAGNLPVARQNQYYAFRFQANYFNPNTPVYWQVAAGGPSLFDQNGDDTFHTSGEGYDSKGFDQTNLALPSGLSLDPATGWLSGTLGTNTAYQQSYTFQITAYVDIDGSIRASQPLTFTLDVLESAADLVTWITDSDLGTIENGAVSTLKIEANTTLGQPLYYTVKSGSYERLPQGLILTNSGELIGRVTFDYFSVDGYTNPVVFDSGTQTYDSKFTFKVLAFNANTVTTTANTATGTTITTTLANATVYSEKDFTITVKNVNTAPYENLYLKALLPTSLRSVFHSIVTDPTLATSEVVYRPDDPYFGLATDLRILAVPGLRAESLATYISAMQNYHYNKKVDFGTIKKAVARNTDSSIKYEVLYLNVFDYNNQVETVSQLPITANVATSILRGPGGTPPSVVAPYFGIASTVFGEHNDLNIYSNSFSNMINEMVSGVGFQDQGALPEWMTSVQPETGQPLGFIHALVLAYANPGQGSKLLYRYKSSLERSGYGVTDIMNTFSFVADRYQLDQTMTVNYNTATGKFKTSKETSFDNIPSTGHVNQGAWVNRSIAGLPLLSLNSVAYAPGYGYLAVGQNSTVLVSSSGDQWIAKSQFIDLTYSATPIQSYDIGSSAFTFDFLPALQVGDEVLREGVFGASTHSYITSVSQRVRLNGNVANAIPSGTMITFIDLVTGGNVYANTVTNTTSGSSSLVLDNIAPLGRGQPVVINGVSTGLYLQSKFSDITISQPSTTAIPVGGQLTFAGVLTQSNVAGDTSIYISNTSKLSVGMGVFGITVNTYTDAAAMWDAVVDSTVLRVSIPTANVHGALFRGMRVIGAGLPASSYISDLVISGATSFVHVGFTTSTVAAATNAVLTFLVQPVVTDGTTISAINSNQVTLSSPLIAPLPLGGDILLQFGLPTIPLYNVDYLTHNGQRIWTAVGGGGTVIYQTPGSAGWNSVAVLNYGDLFDIAQDSTGYYVAVGSEAIIVYSQDLTTWSAPVFVSGANNTLRSVAFGNGKWVAVGDNGSIVTAVPPVATATWNYNPSVTTANLKAVAYIGGQWIAVGSGGTVLLSPDAVTWTVYSVGASNTLNAVTFVNNTYYVAGSQGLIASSSDATSWTIGFSSVSNNLNSMALEAPLPVVVGDSSTILTETTEFVVDWAIRQIPFDKFNWQSVSTLASLGYRVTDGDLLIFAQQENFGVANDGWNYYTAPLDNPITGNLDVGSFDTFTVIPGYNENLANPMVSNQRAGIWKVNVDSSNTVTLTFQRPVNLTQTVTVRHESTTLFFDPTIKPGNFVPAYSLTNPNHSFVSKTTTFDGEGTRFASNKDTFVEPGTLDKYLKFPKTGVFR